MTTGTIANWKKKEGDKVSEREKKKDCLWCLEYLLKVSAGEVLCEIETDKATVSLEAQVSTKKQNRTDQNRTEQKESERKKDRRKGRNRELFVSNISRGRMRDISQRLFCLRRLRTLPLGR